MILTYLTTVVFIIKTGFYKRCCYFSKQLKSYLGKSALAYKSELTVKNVFKFLLWESTFYHAAFVLNKENSFGKVIVPRQRYGHAPLSCC